MSEQETKIIRELKLTRCGMCERYVCPFPIWRGAKWCYLKMKVLAFEVEKAMSLRNYLKIPTLEPSSRHISPESQEHIDYIDKKLDAACATYHHSLWIEPLPQGTSLNSWGEMR